MGRHYNRTKKKDHSYLVGNQHAKRGFQKEDAVTEAGSTDEKLAKEYGVTPVTIWRNGKFAAAVETLKAVDPDGWRPRAGRSPERDETVPQSLARGTRHPETTNAPRGGALLSHCGRRGKSGAPAAIRTRDL
ncbi:MAG: hypothetical protein KBB14_08995 [Thermoanaerobaculia bacterium]|nr:hypothetical protein [Thermoanaerobaculia bacterium]